MNPACPEEAGVRVYPRGINRLLVADEFINELDPGFIDVLIFKVDADASRRVKVRRVVRTPEFLPLDVALMTEPASPFAHPDAHGEAAGFSIVVKRNRSIVPRAMFLGVAGVAGFSFAVGLAFAWFGLWLVLPFVGLEVAALILAFGVYSRHVSDNETIRRDEHGLAVEIRQGNRLLKYRLDAHWAQCVLDNVGREVRLLIGSHGKFVQIGRHLDEEGRRQLRNELNERLREHRAGRD